MREAVISNNERDFIRATLAQALRADGRRFLDHRQLKITLGVTYGHAEISLGQSRVLGVVTAEPVEPRRNQPTAGRLTISVEHSPTASAASHERWQHSASSLRTTPENIELAHMLQTSIESSRMIDLESLCIISGTKVWAIRVDVHILDHGGNIRDAANLAAVVALLHFRRPDVTIRGEGYKVHSLDEREPIPLSVHHIPIATSFAVFEIDGEAKPLVDPTAKEMAVMDAQITVTVALDESDSTAEPMLAAIHKPGGLAVEPEVLLQCVNIATQKCAEITKLIRAVIEEEKEKLRAKPMPLMPTQPAIDTGAAV